MRFQTADCHFLISPIISCGSVHYLIISQITVQQRIMWRRGKATLSFRKWKCTIIPAVYNRDTGKVTHAIVNANWTCAEHRQRRRMSDARPYISLSYNNALNSRLLFAVICCFCLSRRGGNPERRRGCRSRLSDRRLPPPRRISRCLRRLLSRLSSS